MKKLTLLTTVFIVLTLNLFAQGGWTICNSPVFNGRVNDIFMVDTQTGYAVCGDGQIVRTINGGDNWLTINNDSANHRSIEFINSQKGFVGSLAMGGANIDILMRTLDSGATWTDLTPLIDPRARGGVCGLAIPDSNTVYGCGNYFQDSAYIVKSIDGGNTWSFIDMHMYATHLIDMHFLNKDTGFATGTGPIPLRTAVILYTNDGGQTWAYKFQNTIATEWCWKIQHFTDQIYFASVEEGQWSVAATRILKSTDGGMTWNVHIVDSINNNIQGVGFIDSLKGWTGGWTLSWQSYETDDGGVTWDTNHICPGMNRLFKVNDTLLFASGFEIWKYNSRATGIVPVAGDMPQFAFLKCHPNPVNNNLTVDVTITKSTHVLLYLLDRNGLLIKTIDSASKPKGGYQYQIDTGNLTEGIYFVALNTHEDQHSIKVIVTH